MKVSDPPGVCPLTGGPSGVGTSGAQGEHGQVGVSSLSSSFSSSISASSRDQKSGSQSQSAEEVVASTEKEKQATSQHTIKFRLLPLVPHSFLGSPKTKVVEQHLMTRFV